MNRTFAEMIENAADALDGDGAEHYGKAVRQLVADNLELREALGNIREVWAGAEGGMPISAQEAYTIRLCKEMYQEAAAALAATDPNRIFEE